MGPGTLPAFQTSEGHTEYEDKSPDAGTAVNQIHEWMFYEVAWRSWERHQPWPCPWWVQQYFRRWLEPHDAGLFDSKEAAFASNALYRYWNMVGVKDHHQESLIGQSGEVEPVYDRYAVSFFLFDPAAGSLHFPQFPDPDAHGRVLRQEWERGYLPTHLTTYRAMGVNVEQKVVATTLGADQRSIVLQRLRITASKGAPRQGWLCLTVSPVGPSGFQRRDRAGRHLLDGRVTFLRYEAGERRMQVNTSWGPIFDAAPDVVGCYGNPDRSQDPDTYLDDNPYRDLITTGTLNDMREATDHVAGLCSAVCAWRFDLDDARPSFDLDIKLPVDDYRGDDIIDLHAAVADDLEKANQDFWTDKLEAQGLQAQLPAEVSHLRDLFRLCRATLLMLSDHGAIHPGPTIYDSFWVRDSSIEGVTAALAGDTGLPARQFGIHYPTVYNQGNGMIGPVKEHGFFGGKHEKDDREWDSNGQALWAFGRFDRIMGGPQRFGRQIYTPYVTGGARWIRDNRDQHGLLHSGWSAEHVGDKDKPHYWDDLWGLAGLYEAARLAERINAPESGELWDAYDDLRQATQASMRWVLQEQRQQGHWKTFIPTGPADVGRLDSTIVGALAYFYPCRLYMGTKLGADLDHAFRMTLETIWADFVDGGFDHRSAWRAYGPYLTLQLAHAFLYIGDVQRMDRCLSWTVRNAGFATVSRKEGDPAHPWQVVLGAWNEQHAYPIATDYRKFPGDWWYMGDIPHGWAAAEFNALLRDILLFEADEDTDPHLYLAAGVLPHWVADGQEIGASAAPTAYGRPMSYRLTHDATDHRVTIDIQEAPPGVDFVYPCRFGSRVLSVQADGVPIPVRGTDIRFPTGTNQLTVAYE